MWLYLRLRGWFISVLLAVLALSVGACADNLAGGATAPDALIPATYRGRTVELKAWVRRPAGDGPFPAVIVLHGCNGLDQHGWQHANDWAGWLLAQGYVTLVLDSFSPRGLVGVCTPGEPWSPTSQIITGIDRAGDVYAAAAYLAGLTFVQHDHIAALGFSHGGWTVLNAAADFRVGLTPARTALAAKGALAGIVAMYPYCTDTATGKFLVPALIVIGSDDDWTRPELCQYLDIEHRKEDDATTLLLIPGATHAFDDAPSTAMIAFGHRIQADATAVRLSRERIAQFLHRILSVERR
jgi:dienelactone hydrolase